MNDKEYLQTAQAAGFAHQEIQILNSNEWYRPQLLKPLKQKLIQCGQCKVLQLKLVVEDTNPSKLIYVIVVHMSGNKKGELQWVE